MIIAEPPLREPESGIGTSRSHWAQWLSASESCRGDRRRVRRSQRRGGALSGRHSGTRLGAQSITVTQRQPNGHWATIYSTIHQTQVASIWCLLSESELGPSHLSPSFAPRVPAHPRPIDRRIPDLAS